MSLSEIALLIPHFNDIEGLKKTLSSVSDIEPLDLVVVDDGSRIKPNEEELKKEFPQFKNIKVIYLQENRGIEEALNEGLKFILEKDYKYVARCDCRDVNAPERFKIQKKFLEEHPDVCLVGCWAHFVSPSGEKVFSFKPPVHHEDIKKYFFINSPFLHPSVMFRTEVIKKVGFYPKNYEGAEDYAYFFKIAKVCKTANIPDFLIECELNPKGISLSKRRRQILSRLKVLIHNFEPNPYWFYGLIRNTILLFTPYKLVELLKRTVKK